MRKLILLVLLLSFGVPSRAKAAPLLDLSRVDTYAHMGLSYAACFTGIEVLEKYKVPRWKSVLYSVVGTMALGVTKELLDSSFDVGDLTADIVGTGLAVGVVLTFDL